VLAGFSMVFLVKLPTLIKEIGSKAIFRFAGIGVITALHWVTFYASINYANASIALVCLATTSFFIALIEPLFLRRKIQWLDLGIGVVIFPGMVLIVSNLQGGMLTGVYLGLLSAMLAATFVTLNKKYIEDATPLRITFIEMVSSALFLSLAILYYYDFESLMPTMSDWVYLIILALLCTTLAQYLAMSSLRHLSAFNSVLIVNLEPVYGILLAAILLKEYNELTMTFYIGAAIIVSVVFIYPFLKRRQVH